VAGFCKPAFGELENTRLSHLTQLILMSSLHLYLGLDFAKEKFNYHGAELRGTLPNTPARPPLQGIGLSPFTPYR
jgi:hypothetical protein